MNCALAKTVACVLLVVGSLAKAQVTYTCMSSADAFLATQGDPFDTQSDMFCALIGAGVAQILLTKVHDRELRRIPIQDGF